MSYHKLFCIGFVAFGIIQSQEIGCPDGWVSFDTSCYLFSNSPAVHYTEAEHYCLHHHNSHLVTIETAKENAFLRDYASRLKGPDYWIGLSDELVEGDWKWESTGNTAVYTDWYTGQPDNAGNAEDCVHLYSVVGYHWNDVSCIATYRPLCEQNKVVPLEVVG